MSRRRSLRLRGYDYSQIGDYFVTLCTEHRACTLGAIEDGLLVLSPAGQTVYDVWSGIPTRFAGIEIDAFVVMPNHIHGIVVIGTKSPSVQANPKRTSLG